MVGASKKSKPVSIIPSISSESDEEINSFDELVVDGNTSLNTSESEFLERAKISEDSSNVEEEEITEKEVVELDEDDQYYRNFYNNSKLTLRQQRLLDPKDELEFLQFSSKKKINVDYQEDLKSEELKNKKALQRKISKERKIEEARKAALSRLLTKKQRGIDTLDSNKKGENKKESPIGPVPEGAIRYYDSQTVTLVTYPFL